MKRKLSFSVLLMGVLILVGSTAAYAATYLTYGYPSSTIPIKSYSYNDTWQVPMDASLSNWNNANAKVTFSKNSNSTNTITAAQFDYEDYGVNYVTYSGSEVTKFRIELNARKISADATDFSKFVQSVFVHELGHSIWLGDNPSTTSSSIMKYSRDRNTMTKPQTFDINNVKAKY
ncbi:hypothetical protein [Paenibacillus silvae]|uniref:Peptidase M10 metallopeptidase domain-containing protein n=1 Tax=Paenibacillus silvae TaxID=1325358 RepID=A0A2W6NLM9_9BACL|nr:MULTISPECIES: hypothetical protein [Paenibacillus]MCK6078452.1 hypothetical protein [Paenibacillus silvae]MCK6152687.1 hypothetical protein [Paenibacillus silvae]MCK6271137.1 hypothetical protein [Paenibacillus silvae]PZT56655.1 hypothetical protein DN757_05220 [Paenibacillus silvae]